MRIELTTSSLPRKCSTTELQRQSRKKEREAIRQPADATYSSLFIKSGRRGSNPRPIAWKAIALPTELLPHYALNLPGRLSLYLPIAIGMSYSRIQNTNDDKLRLPETRPLTHKPDPSSGSGGNRIRTYEVIRQQIYSLSQLAALVFPQFDYNKKRTFFLPLKKQECKIILFYTFSKLKCLFSFLFARMLPLT